VLNFYEGGGMHELGFWVGYPSIESARPPATGQWLPSARSLRNRLTDFTRLRLLTVGVMVAPLGSTAESLGEPDPVRKYWI
jgi:hypothetical protein